MRRTHLVVLVAVGILLALPLGAANENINYADINRIKTEGMQRSQVMELNSWLSDVYSPRLTGSPMAEKAGNWVVGKLKPDRRHLTLRAGSGPAAAGPATPSSPLAPGARLP